MGAGASFHANDTGRQIAKKHRDLRAPQLLAQQRPTSLIHSMY
jgi:hypothetical protein